MYISPVHIIQLSKAAKGARCDNMATLWGHYANEVSQPDKDR